MATATSSKQTIWLILIVVVIAAGSLSIPAVRNLALKSLQSLRMQKVQAVNADFSPYVDANANPTLHQMVTQMISDKVQVEVNEEDHPVTDAAGARQIAGFDVLLLSARKDAPTLVVGGSHKIAVTVDRARLQAIATEAGHPDIVFPQSLDGATVEVQVPRSVQVQYGTCPSARERQPGRRRQHYRTFTDYDAVSATVFACVKGQTRSSTCLRGLDVGGLGANWPGDGGHDPSSSQ